MPTPVKRVVRKPAAKKAVAKKPTPVRKVASRATPVKKVAVIKKPAAPRKRAIAKKPAVIKPVDESVTAAASASHVAARVAQAEAATDVPVAAQTVVAQPVYFNLPGNTHHLCIYQSDVAPVAVRQPMSHYLVIDRSGSMYGEIKHVIEDVIDRLSVIPDGDIVNVGWFSSEGGQFGWITTSHQLHSSNRSALAKTIREFNYTVACTCFSEILESTLKMLQAQPGPTLNTLVFFTDGYPVVRDTVKEMDKVRAVLSHLGEYMHAAMFVGYGRYYQRENLFEMASATNGIMIASDDVANFNGYLGDFWARSTQSQPRVPVKLAPLPGQNKRDLIFGVVNGEPVRYFPDDLDKVYLLPLSGTNTVVAYELRAGPAPDPNRTALADEQLVYAAAYLLSQSGQSDLSITLLGGLGDVKVVRTLYNAFTPEEWAAAEKLIGACVSDAGIRYGEGVNYSFVPQADAFCVVDALDILLADTGLCLDTTASTWVYNRIGVKSEVKEEVTSEWIPGSGIVKVNDATWNQEFLNLSVKVQEPGSVKFDAANAARAKQLGLLSPYPAIRFRTYTIVKDGSLNLSILPVRLGYDTFVKLYKHGVIDDDFWAADKTINIRLDRLPVMNRVMAKNLPNLSELAVLKLNELKAMAKLRILKFKREALDPEKTVVTGDTSLTSDQIAFLKAHSLSASGWYSPPSRKAEPIDFYDVKVFKIDVVGLTSLSNTKIDDVITRMKDKKAQTAPGKLLAEALEWYDIMAPVEGGRLVELAWIDAQLQDVADERDQARQKIQRTKFAVVLGKSWFPDAPSRDSGKVTLGDVEINIKLDTARVGY